MTEPFAVLMSVYAADKPAHVRRAFRSAVDDQTLRPDQVIIVRDGPVAPELEHTVDELCRSSTAPVTLVRLEHNVGLGPALDAGLNACWYEIVARMDADDVAMPHRFEVQLPLMADTDILGAGLFEFEQDTHDVVGQRVPPTEPAQIRAYARMHDPFNHPTVVYRRSAVFAAGGYGDLHRMEDYALFSRMLDMGARAKNVAEPLVFYRVGAAAFRRRGGVGLLRSELQLQRDFLDRGFVTTGEYARNVVVRGGYRLVPWRLRRAMYTRIVPLYSERLDALMTPAYAQPPTLIPPTDIFDDELELRAIA